jgi:predicted amidohydrolase YtcJ
MNELVIHNGCVLTQANPRVAAAVLIRDGRIASVGDARDLLRECGSQATRIDLGGRTLVPGFNDAHAHIWKIGHLRTTMLDLRGTRSIEEITNRVQAFDHRLPNDAWLLGRGYNEAALREGRAPSRRDLDRVAPDRPILLTRTCGHICAVNSRALVLAGITSDTAAPTGGVIDRDGSGEPTGLLHETAMGLVTRVLPPTGAAEYETMIRAALQHQLSVGITSSSDCGVSPQLIRVYLDLDAGGMLPARVNVMPLRRLDGVRDPVRLPARHVSDMLRIDTAKFLADGGLSGATAALGVRYRHADTRGVLRFDESELLELCRETHTAGWRIATHAIGDVAIDQVLSIYEQLGPHKCGVAHRIEHFGLPNASQLARAARLGVIAAPQPVFLRSLGRNFRQYLPDSLLSRAYPIRAMLDAGVCVALSSDAPVVEDDDPLVGMAAAVTRCDDEGDPIALDQAITIQEALFGYTMGGAIASGDADNRGSIEPGKWADLAVLSQNPLDVEPAKLAELKVEMTLLAGRIVFES